LEWAYDDHLVQLRDQFRDYQKLKKIVMGTVQMCLKHCQAWGIDHLARKPVLVFDHHVSKEMLPNVQSKLPLVQF